MLSKVDLVALVSVSNVDEKNVQGLPKAQLAHLNVEKVFYGTSSDVIILDQAVDYVKVGERSIMFLRKNGGYYYEADRNSLLKENNGRFISNIPGLKGEFTLDQFSTLLKEKLSQIKQGYN